MSPVLLAVFLQFTAAPAIWSAAYLSMPADLHALPCEARSYIGAPWCPPGASSYHGVCYPECRERARMIVCSCQPERSAAFSLPPPAPWNRACDHSCPPGLTPAVEESCSAPPMPSTAVTMLNEVRTGCGHEGLPPCYIWQRLAPCDMGLRIHDHVCQRLPPGASPELAQVADWFVEFSASGQHACESVFQHIPIDVSVLNHRLVGAGTSAECARNFVSGFFCAAPQMADLSGAPALLNIILEGQQSPQCRSVPLPLKPLCSAVTIVQQDVVEASACVVKAMRAGAFKSAMPSVHHGFDTALCTQMGQIAFGAAQSRLMARLASSPSQLLVVRVAKASLQVYNSVTTPNSIVSVLQTIDECAGK